MDVWYQSLKILFGILALVGLVWGVRVLRNRARRHAEEAAARGRTQPWNDQTTRGRGNR
jgi:O-antigen ligase